MTFAGRQRDTREMAERTFHKLSSATIVQWISKISIVLVLIYDKNNAVVMEKHALDFKHVDFS